jgi:hypothetical protein
MKISLLKRRSFMMNRVQMHDAKRIVRERLGESETFADALFISRSRVSNAALIKTQAIITSE